MRKATKIVCLCIAGALFAACGAKETASQSSDTSSVVIEKPANTETSVSASVSETSAAEAPASTETSTSTETSISAEPSAQVANEPFTVDSCAGTYTSEDGDSFTFECDPYQFKDFVWNGATVEEKKYPYFLEDYFTTKADGVIEAMTGVVDDKDPASGYMIRFYPDGTIEVQEVSMATGPKGEAKRFSK